MLWIASLWAVWKGLVTSQEKRGEVVLCFHLFRVKGKSMDARCFCWSFWIVLMRFECFDACWCLQGKATHHKSCGVTRPFVVSFLGRGINGMPHCRFDVWITVDYFRAAHRFGVFVLPLRGDKSINWSPTSFPMNQNMKTKSMQLPWCLPSRWWCGSRPCFSVSSTSSWNPNTPNSRAVQVKYVYAYLCAWVMLGSC